MLYGNQGYENIQNWENSDQERERKQEIIHRAVVSQYWGKMEARKENTGDQELCIFTEHGSSLVEQQGSAARKCFKVYSCPVKRYPVVSVIDSL